MRARNRIISIIYVVSITTSGLCVILYRYFWYVKLFQRVPARPGRARAPRPGAVRVWGRVHASRVSDLPASGRVHVSDAARDRIPTCPGGAHDRVAVRTTGAWDGARLRAGRAGPGVESENGHRAPPTPTGPGAGPAGGAHEFTLGGVHVTWYDSRPTRTIALADVVDRVLDRGIMIDARGCRNPPRLRIVEARSRLVVASVEIYLDYGRTMTSSGPLDRFDSRVSLMDGRPGPERRVGADEDRLHGSFFMIREVRAP